MDKPLGADWQWVMKLFKTYRDRTMWTDLELRSEEALKELAAENARLRNRLANIAVAASAKE